MAGRFGHSQPSTTLNGFTEWPRATTTHGSITRKAIRANVQSAGAMHAATLGPVDLLGALLIVAALMAAGVVQSAVIHFDLLPSLAVPMDAHRELGGQPILGPNKTWRGVLVMTAASAAAASLIFELRPPIGHAVATGWSGLGAAMGLTYVAAELPNSFVKRRFGIGAGARAHRFAAAQFLVDQADSVVGVALMLFFALRLTWLNLVELVGIGTATHAAFDVARRSISGKRRVIGGHATSRTSGPGR